MRTRALHRHPKNRASKLRGDEKKRHGAPSAKTVGQVFEELVALQARLRGPGGCPWDREQTSESLHTFLVEETYEVLDAMQEGDPKKITSELGDLMLQIVFQSLLAEEKRQFNISDVIRSVHDKMVRRHPHVFGKARAETSAQVLKHWEEIKAAEKQGAAESDFSLLHDVPRSLPALPEASQITRRAAMVGFDWENIDGVLEKLREEAEELRSVIAKTRGSAEIERVAASSLEEEIGDILFAAANVACFAGVDPEIALKQANRKFRRRFEWMEKEARKRGRQFASVPRARMEELWNQSKARA